MNPPIFLHERPLLISDEDSFSLYKEVAPEIGNALSLHGYLEYHSSDERVPLDTTSILHSEAYVKNLGTINKEDKRQLVTNFDALTINTTYNVDDNSKILIDADIDLKKIGGIAAARISKKGPEYSIKFNSNSADLSKIEAVPLNYYEAVDIMEDIQAATSLGRPANDSLHRNFSGPVAAIESLLSKQFFERSTHLQYVDGSSEYSDTEARLAETLLVSHHRDGAKLGRSIVALASSLEVFTTQDVFGGTMTTGIHYKSRRLSKNKVDVTAQLSAKVDSDLYPDDAELSMLLQHTVDQYQDPEGDKFSRAAIAHILKLSDPDFGVIRIA